MGKCSEWTLVHTGCSETLWTPRPWGLSPAHPKFHDLLTNWLLDTPLLASVLGSWTLSLEIPLGMALWYKISLRTFQVNWPLHPPKPRFCFTVNTLLCPVVSCVNSLPNWHPLHCCHRLLQPDSWTSGFSGLGLIWSTSHLQGHISTASEGLHCEDWGWTTHHPLTSSSFCTFQSSSQTPQALSSWDWIVS